MNILRSTGIRGLVLSQFVLVSSGALAQPLGTYSLMRKNSLESVAPVSSQYKFVPVPELGLMSVLVLGGVRKPGVHYIPERSNILSVIALAGGTTDEAKNHEIAISAPQLGSSSGYRTVGKFDMRGYLTENEKGVEGALPEIKSNYVIYVPEYRPPIDRDVTSVVTFVGSLASIALTFLLIKQRK